MEMTILQAVLCGVVYWLAVGNFAFRRTLVFTKTIGMWSNHRFDPWTSSTGCSDRSNDQLWFI